MRRGPWTSHAQIVLEEEEEGEEEERNRAVDSAGKAVSYEVYACAAARHGCDLASLACRTELSPDENAVASTLLHG